MAVESRFVVIRNGVEAKTFMDKKSADEYDKMLDMADNLSEMFASSSVELSDDATEELSIFLAEHREEVLVALLAKKPAKKATAKPVVKAVVTSAESTSEESITETKDAEPHAEETTVKPKKAKTKATKAKGADKTPLSEAS